MSFNLTYLKYFFDAIVKGGITASAKENFVTQSAVSQGIIKLENHFKRKLLTHKRNSIKLTPEGEMLFASAKQLFRYIGEINDTFVEGDHAYKGKVEFASYYSIVVSLLPRPLAKFQKIAPNVATKFITGRHEIVRDAIKKGSVEFGILMDSEELSAFDCELVHSGYFHVYESSDRPINEPVTKCIFTDPHPEVFSLKKSFKKNYGKELHTHMEVGSWEVIANLVISNVGVGLFPDYLAHVPYRQAFLRQSQIEHDPIPYNLFAVAPKGEELSKNAKLLVECIRDSQAIK